MTIKQKGIIDLFIQVKVGTSILGTISCNTQGRHLRYKMIVVRCTREAPEVPVVCYKMYKVDT